MSDTSVALISSGSALGASLITGVLTWLAGRSQVVLQLRDQKRARSEQHRRETYAVCLELLTEYVTWSMTLMARRVRGQEDRIPEAHQKVADGSKMMMRRAAQMQVAGPAAVAEAFEVARSAAQQVADALEQALEEGRIVGDHPPPIRAETQAFDRAMEAFTRAARSALEAD